MNNFEQRQKIYDTLTNIAYYIIIGLVSVCSVVFLPMINSSMEGGVEFPTTPIGWAIWVITKLLIALINIIVFYCFTQQAVVNVKDNEEYKRANKIMDKIKKSKGLMPRSPIKFLAKEWGTKGLFIFLGSLASTIVLAEAILSFDLPQFLSYLFTIGLGIVCGYLTMRKHEGYWVSEYPAYADYIWDKHEQEAQEKLKLEEAEQCLISETKNLEISSNK